VKGGSKPPPIKKKVTQGKAVKLTLTRKRTSKYRGRRGRIEKNKRPYLSSQVADRFLGIVRKPTVNKHVGLKNASEGYIPWQRPHEDAKTHDQYGIFARDLADRLPKMLEENGSMPQEEVTPLVLDINQNIFQQVAAGFPLFSIARGIVKNDMVSVGGNNIDVKYLVYVTLMYDLFEGMKGRFTIFDRAPGTWWDLRDTWGPTILRGRGYRLNLPEEFIGSPGSMFPAGVPFQVGGNVTLSWPTDLTQPLAPMSNVVPALTVEAILESGVEASLALFNKLSQAGAATVTAYETTAMFGSTAGFAAVRSKQGYSFSTDFTRVPGYYGVVEHENDIPEHEMWAASIGMVDVTSGPIRIPAFSKPTFMGAINVYDRIANNVFMGGDPSDPFPIRRPRPHPVYIEDFLQSVIIQMVQAQLKKWKVRVDDSTLEDFGPFNPITGMVFTSDFSSITEAELLRGLVVYLNRMYAGSNWVGAFSIPDQRSFPFAGSRFMSDLTTASLPFPANLSECKGDLSPFPMVDRYIEYPVLMSNGNFRVHHSMNSAAPVLTGIQAAVVDIYPDYDPTTVSIPFSARIDLLPNYVNMASNNVSVVQGAAQVLVLNRLNSLYQACNGNLLLSSGFVNHENRTIIRFKKYLRGALGNDPSWSSYGRFDVEFLAATNEFPPDFVVDLVCNPTSMIYSATDDELLGWVNMYDTTHRIREEEPSRLYISIAEGALWYVRETASEFPTSLAIADVRMIQNCYGDFSFIRGLASRLVGAAKRAMDSGVPQQLINRLNNMLSDGAVDAIKHTASVNSIAMPRGIDDRMLAGIHVAVSRLKAYTHALRKKDDGDKPLGPVEPPDTGKVEISTELYRTLLKTVR
jgi:hypothetical protein